MFRYRTGQRERKTRLQAILAEVKYETLTEPEKGHFNEMKYLMHLNYWVPSEYQIEQSKKLVKNEPESCSSV